MPILVMAGSPTPAHATTNTGQIKQEIFNFSWEMKKNNYAEETIHRYTRGLTTLANRGADIRNPESVKQTIALQKWENGTKQSVTNAINLFYLYNNINTILPKFNRIEKMVFVPTENEIDQLISGCKHRLATFLQTLKETAARYGEALNLKWTDYNTETQALSITPEKGSNPRMIKISNKLAVMISSLPRDNAKIFPYKCKDIARKNLQRARKRIAKNLGNPRINQIHFHTLRHWKASQELRRTNNIYYVMKMLGHKSLSNTQRYIHLLEDLSDDYICEVATTPNEIIKLINAGFEKVTEMNGQQFFRKRK
jgi:integrase